MRLLKTLLLALTLTFGYGAAAWAQDIDWLINLNDTGSDPVPAGGTITYNFAITNGGVDPAPATTFDFTIPSGTTLTQVTGFSGCTTLPLAGPATLTCDVPPLLADAEASGTIALLTTVAGVVSADMSVPTPGDVLPSNNEANETTSVIAGADLTMTIAGPLSATAGSTVSYTLTTENLGPNTASGMVVDFPPVTGFTVDSTPAGCTLSAGTYLCAIPGTLALGETFDFVFTGQLTAASGSTVTPLAGVTAGSPADPITENNTNTFNTTVTAGTDLRLSKTRTPTGTLLVGDTVTFTLQGTYTGDNPSTITLTDTLPALYLPQTATGAGWTCDILGQTVTCERATGSGPGNDIALPTITLTADVVATGTAVNTASISALSPIDPDTTNNSANDGGATAVEPTIDLRANKSGPNPPLTVVGNSYTFSLSTSNIGTTGFFGTVVMQDSLPAGMTLTNITTNGWSCGPALPLVGPATLTCERVYTAGSPLAAGATTPAITTTVLITDTGSITNTLNVSSPDGNLPDLNGPNNSTNVITTGSVGPASADIALSKTATLPSLVVGDVQTYTIELTNIGPQASTNITLVDDLTNLINNAVGPTGAGYIGHTITPGLATGLTCSTSAMGTTARRLSCDIDALPICTPGLDCPTISVDVRPGGNGGGRTNTVTAFSQTIADPVVANNTAEANFSVTPRADVTVTKVGSPNPAAAGQNLTYVITATNTENGLSQAENVTVVDTLPAGVTFVSAAPSSGTCATTPTPGATTLPGDTVVCNFGTIANGAQRTATIVVRPNNDVRGTDILNTVTVSTTTPELDTDNNTDTIETFVNNPAVNLFINKTDSIDPVAIGDDTVYTITISNNGPSVAENAVITDTLPATRLRYQSHTVSGGGVCDTVPAVNSFGGTLSCTWPILSVGQTQTVQVTMRADTKGVAINTANASSDETIAGFETNLSNNTAGETTTIRTRADMEVVSKTPSADPVNLRETFTYTVRLRNNAGPGLSEADEVFMTDTLPAGMELTGTPTVSIVSGSASITTCTGAAGSTSFTCSLGTVASTSVIDITIPTQIVSVTAYPQTFTNTASVTTSSLDVNPSNNSNSSAMTINSSSLLGRVFRDFNDNQIIDAQDTGLSGITMTLTGIAFDNEPITRTTTTAANGTYAFQFVPQGVYTITRGAISETYLLEGESIAGDQGGTAATESTITDITLPANTQGEGYNFTKVPQARLGLAKNVQGGITVLTDGSVRATLRHTLRNYSLEPLINITVTDALNGPTPNKFGTHVSLAAPATDPLAAGTYTVYNRTTTCGTGTVNTNFNGDSDTTLLSGVTRPNSTASCTVDFIIRYQPVAPLLNTAASRWSNQSTMTGEGQWSGQTSATNPQLIDLSHTGTNPDPNNNRSAIDNNTPTVVNPSLAGNLSLRKRADTFTLGNPLEAGDLITYSFDIRNLGNLALTNVTVSNPMLGGVISGSPIAVIPPGETVTLTATYPITAGDIASGTISNQASVIGTYFVDAGGNPITTSALSGNEFGNTNPTLVNFGRIALVKTVDTSALSNPVAVGDQLTYAFSVRNAGDVPLTNVTISDPLPGIALSGAPISLAPGETNTTNFTATYTLTQADIDAGRVDNQATATGQWGIDGSGDPILTTDLSGTAFNNDTTTSATIAQAPQIRVIKTADATGLQDPAVIGDSIGYTFTIQNTGNVTLDNVTLTDPLTGLVLTGAPIASMAPGDIDTTTYSATYAINQADINNGFVENQASVVGTYTDATNTPQTTTDLSGATNGDNDPTIVPVAQNGTITLVKTVDTSGLSTPVAVGDPLTYTFAIENTGNVTLDSITITDPLPGIVLSGGPISLTPGAVDSTTFTATYPVTQADIDAGFVENQARVTGVFTDLNGLPINVIDDSGTNTTNDDPTLASLPQTPAIALIKTADTSALSNPPAPGDTITYAFTVENTGNTTLNGITVTDPLPGITLSGGPITLAPGASNTTAFTATYELTQTDINTGFVENQASVLGNYTNENGMAQTVTDDSGTTIDNDDPTVVTGIQAPEVALIKSVDTSGLSSPVIPGDVLAYDFTIINTGNTTLTNLTVADPLPGLVLTGSPVASLLPGNANVSAYSATYTLTQADIDAGFVENQATVTAGYTDAAGTPQTVTDDSGTAVDNDTPTVAADLQTPSLLLTKSGDASALSTPSALGDILSYTFTVENTGNTTLTNVTLTENLTGAIVAGGPITMAPGAVDTVTFTATYPIVQGDIDAGFVNNLATITGSYTDEEGTPQTTTNTDTVQLLVPQDPAIALIKSVDTSALSTPVVVGDTLTYAFTMENTGNTTLSGITIADPLPGIVLSGAPITLAPGADDTTTFTATYAITQADIDAGLVENQATVTGGYTDATGTPRSVTDTSGSAIDNDDITTALITQTPAIALIKTADTSALSTPVVVGDTLTYAFTVENTGNTTLSGITIADPLPGIVLSGGPITLAPGADDTTTFTATYAITQADIDAGLVENQATVTGGYTDATGTPQSVTDDSGTALGNDDPTVVTGLQTPAIALIKTADTTALATPPAVGDTITYAFTVENTGNTTLSGITIADPLPGIVLSGGPITLAPGADDTTTFTATYAITQGDIDTGFVENQATVTGTYTDATNTAQTVTDDSGTALDNDDVTIAPVGQLADIHLIKTVDGSALNTPPMPGDVLTYAFRVENTGNVTLNTVTVTDPLPGLVLSGDPITLAPGASDTSTFTATYAITQADINAGLVENQATVSGAYVDGGGTPQTATDDSGSAIGNDDPTIQPIAQDPSIALLKTVDTSALSTPVAVGDTLTYAFTVENTGNTTLSGVSIADPLPGIMLSGAPITLNPGEEDTATFTATYAITQADIDAGLVDNQATVTGGYTDATGTPQTVTDDSGTALDNDTITTAIIPQTPTIALIKTADSTGLSVPPVPGDTITYAFTVENTGNTTLTDVTLFDPLPGIVLAGDPITLAPGATDTTTFTATYALTQADINAGLVENQATIVGTYTNAMGLPTLVSDDSGTTLTNNDPTVVTGLQNAAIALVKTVDTSALSTPPTAGDILTYAFTVENTGNTTLDTITISDPLPGIVLSGDPITLAPGATDTTTFTATYALTQADIDTGFIENQATVTGAYTDATNTPQSVTDDSGTASTNDEPTLVTGLQNPSIALRKTADITALSSPPVPGDVVAYTFTVENTGNTTLSGITISDPLPGIVLLGGPITLAPGATDTTTFTATYAITQTDIDDGLVENQATVSGAYTDADGLPQTVTDLSGTELDNDLPTIAAIAQNPAIDLVKTVDGSALSTPPAAGDTLTYTFVVRNTGNTTLSDIAITDPLPGIMLSGGPITLTPGGLDATTFTATYTLQQADVNQGFVENQATVAGTYTDGDGITRTVEDTSGTSVGQDDATVQPLTQTPSLTLEKTVDTSAVQSPAQIGDILTYAFALENTGNVTLDITLVDPLPGLVLSGDPITLAPGATDTGTYTATYALTQNDLDNGFVENTAQATGAYTDETNTAQTVQESDDARATFVQAPAITLVKTVDDSGLSTPVIPGDVLTYTFTATNSGLITLTDVTLNDPLPGLVVPTTDFGTMTPGTTRTLTATYALTQTDIDAGFVENQATVTGAYTDETNTAQTTTDTSGTDTTNDDPTRLTITQDPSIQLIKQAFVNEAGGIISAIGDEIDYTFAITNTGNVTLENVTLSDTLPGIVLVGDPIPTLAPGATDTTTYTATYAVVAADFVAAEVINQATVTGTYSEAGGPGIVVEAVSGTEATNNEPTIVSIGLPDIALDITIIDTNDVNNNGRLDLDDIITYAFTVTNTGNVPLTDVNIIPASMSLDFPALTCASITLAVGETATLVCTGNAWTITPEDVARGSVVLEGQAQGASPASVVVNASASSASLVVAQNLAAPSLLAEKIANVDEARFGDTIRYTITMRHNEQGGLPIQTAIIDRLPTGFAYVEGSATLNGTPVNPTNTSQTLVFPTRTLLDGQTLTATLSARVLSSAGPGVHTNQAWGDGPTGRLSNIATADVRVVVEPVFSCGTVIGRVFVDRDQDGRFNHDTTQETGLGGIRLVAPNGVSVITDTHGRYNLPCEALPSSIGSNFQLKLDERTLPTGFVLTTENPRVVRLTAGMVTRLDFGVNPAQPVRVDLDARAFDGNTPSNALRSGLSGLVTDISTTPSVVRIVYHLSPGESAQDGNAKVRQTRRTLESLWRGAYPLRIETQVLQTRTRP